MEGQARNLAMTLAARFGPLPPWCLHALRAADAAELSTITLRMLDAQCAADVFSGGVCRCRGGPVDGRWGWGSGLEGA